MKKIKILLLICSGLIPCTMLSQFNTYRNSEIPQARSSAPIQQTYGYIPTSSGWVRVNIQVQATEYSIYVVGYKEKNNSGYSQYFNSYGGDSWRSCHANAQRVTEFSDGQLAANNFDYKASIPGLGTVYF